MGQVGRTLARSRTLAVKTKKGPFASLRWDNSPQCVNTLRGLQYAFVAARLTSDTRMLLT